MITRVRKLTHMNISALNTVRIETGATYVDFNLTPRGALRVIEEAISTTSGTTRKSLHAVRRKLADAVPRYDSESHDSGTNALTVYVSVTK